MRKVTKTYNVYTYCELSDEAKEKAKQWILNDIIKIFLDLYEKDLEYLYEYLSEIEIEEECRANGWEFLEDGTLHLE